MIFFLLSLFIFFLFLYLLLQWGSQPYRNINHKIMVKALPPLHSTSSETIRLMSYNIGFAGGLDNLKGRIYSKKKQSNYLGQIIHTIQEDKPDILAIQEIDLPAHRSYHTNQIDIIANACEYPYVAYTITWNKHWVPYPLYRFFWNQFGSVISALAIFSMYPIQSQTPIRLPKPLSSSFIYNQFYLNRLVQLVNIQVSNYTWLKLGNLHLEAFDEKTRELQLELIQQYLTVHQPSVLLGDFNTNNLDGFIENTSWKTALKESTFPSNSPEEQLDHILFTDTLIKEGARVLQKGDGSDHLPITATFSLKSRY